MPGVQVIARVVSKYSLYLHIRLFTLTFEQIKFATGLLWFAKTAHSAGNLTTFTHEYIMTCTLCDNYIGSSDLFVAPNETCNTFHSCNTFHI